VRAQFGTLRFYCSGNETIRDWCRAYSESKVFIGFVLRFSLGSHNGALEKTVWPGEMDYPDLSLLKRPQVALSHRISEIVGSRASRDQIVQELMRIAVEVGSCDVCLVYFSDPVNGDAVLRTSQLAHANKFEYVRPTLGEGVTGWDAEHREIVVLSRAASSDSRFKQFAWLLEEEFQALLSVPLIIRGKVMGVLNVHHREPHEHTTDEIVLTAFAGQQMASAIALSQLAVENARLKAETQEIKKRLEERRVLERAKGVLQERFKLTEEQAYVRLRNESRRSRRPIRELAEAVLMVEGMAPPK
jgi:signal transduction protein with GAF and PtsI domain